MILLGAIVNGAAIIAGGIVGVLIKKGIPKRLNTLMMQGMGLCVIYIGISGSLDGEKTIVTILSIVVGGVIGQLIDFDKWLNHFGSLLQQKVKSENSDNSFAEGFVNFSIVACVGAMSVVGSLQSGISGNHEILYAKALIDGVLAIVMSATMGIGVALAGVSVLIYEIILTLLAGSISSYLSTTVVNEMTCVGSLIIVAIGLNMLKITNIKVANLLLASFLPILFCCFL